MSMNILFISKLLPRADIIGGPILIYHRIKNLSSKGHKVTLIAPVYDDVDRRDVSLDPFCEEVIKIESVKDRSDDEVEELHRRLKRPKFFLYGDGGFNQGVEDALKSVLKKRHFNAIITEFAMMGQYIEANKEIIPDDTMTVESVHECYTKAFQMRIEKGEDISKEIIDELFDYEFSMYRCADKILSLTREDGEILSDYAPELKEKIRVVPHGADTDFYTPPDEDPWERGTKNVIYVGNFQHYPNVDAVLNFMKNCWGRIEEEVPDAKFYAVGLHPPEELIKFRSDNVIVQEGGSNDDVRELYRNSDILVAPIELGTGFRGKIIEAMACGLPIVATTLATFGIDPVNEEEMFVTDDYEQFSRYVIMLLRDKELREKTSKNSLALAKKFDHRCAAEKLEKMLTEGKG